MGLDAAAGQADGPLCAGREALRRGSVSECGKGSDTVPFLLINRHSGCFWENRLEADRQRGALKRDEGSKD